MLRLPQQQTTETYEDQTVRGLHQGRGSWMVMA
jgi:hypothetical protein